MPRDNGFTMIEVLIALSVIALVSVVAIPNFKRFSARQDVINSSSTVVSVLRKAQSNAVSDIRCSADVGGEPTPSFSFDIHFDTPTYTTSTTCVGTSGTPLALDFIASPVPDPNGSFQGNFNYNDSLHIVLWGGAAVPKGSGNYDPNSVCTGGKGYVSFRGSGVYFSCIDPGNDPNSYCKLPLFAADTKPGFCPNAASHYLMILHDDRNTTNAEDIIITISPTGVIDVI